MLKCRLHTFKSLLNSSELYHKAKNNFGNLGIETGNLKLNLKKNDDE